MPTLRLSQVCKAYGKHPALSGLDLEIRAGERVAVLGPTGCGKSTLLRIIAGLARPTSGDLLFDDTSVKNWVPFRRDVGMIFQHENLVPHLNVEQNLGFGLKLRNFPPSKIAELVGVTVERLGLQDYLTRRPDQLSGGEKQRVALGRLITTRAKIWLLDEPLAHVDPVSSQDLRHEICRWHDQLGSTLVHVSHDHEEAMSLGQRVAVMRNGAIAQIGLAETVYDHPKNRFVASFLGTPPMNLIRSTASRGQLTMLDVQIAMPRLPDRTTLWCGFRPEALRLDDKFPIQISGTVRSVAYLGHMAVVRVTVNGEGFCARVPLPCSQQPGSSIRFGLRPDDLHFYEDDPSGLEIRLL